MDELLYAERDDAIGDLGGEDEVVSDDEGRAVTRLRAQQRRELLLPLRDRRHRVWLVQDQEASGPPATSTDASASPLALAARQVARVTSFESC